MQKGKFGFYLWYYALTAFILAFLGQTLLVGILLGFVIVVEKNEWAIRQSMQAFGLSVATLIINGVYNIGGSLSNLDYLSSSYYYGGFSGFSALGYVLMGLAGICFILVVIFFIMALTRVIKGKEANIPILNSVVDKVFGVVKQQPFYQPPTGGPGQPNYTAQPGQQPNYDQPQQPNYNAGANPYAPPQAPQEPVNPQTPPQDSNNPQ